MAEAALALDQDPGADRDRWLRRSAVDPAARVPVFAEAMEAVAAAWTASFCGLAASEGLFAFNGLRALRVDDVLQDRDSLPILAALRAPAWNSMVGLSLDRAVVSTVVEAFFGGNEDDMTADNNRPVSPVEMRIVDVVAGQAAAALTAGLKPVAAARIEFDRTLPKPDAAFLGKPPTPLLAARFGLTTIGRTVWLDILVPQAAIDAEAATWAGTATEAAPLLDEAGWTRQLASEVSRAALRVDAEIAMAPMSLGALAKLQPGQVLELPEGAGGQVLLRCGDERLFRCDLGQSAGFYTVRIHEALDRDAQPSRKGR